MVKYKLLLFWVIRRYIYIYIDKTKLQVRVRASMVAGNVVQVVIINDTNVISIKTETGSFVIRHRAWQGPEIIIEYETGDSSSVTHVTRGTKRPHTYAEYPGLVTPSYPSDDSGDSDDDDPYPVTPSYRPTSPSYAPSVPFIITNFPFVYPLTLTVNKFSSRRENQKKKLDFF